ncbi:DNA polymerase III subunit gamma/tau [Altererythrobacter sp. CC-YST694]|uniref:DNA polymerase III subunit gamma/tau n=1 Tax=Altererythrobacter sp. CC-YST694 TaxID=2755038 RepID=UPI001D00CEF8|nr:DNA polymerase III subunit gamma/tau [Altererythrobacter sp. CC-YST694]MCB5424772.1 DNA polymerase III subunit gamma/tau [Altererythrobacter sp. CC-YST694]
MADSPHIDGEEETQPSTAELEAAGQSALFGGPVDSGPEKPAPLAAAAAAAPVEPKPAAAQPYRVLARKYRPQTFAELIGQDAMVKTLANAIARDRLAHAFLMTGVRGVGKTSTARLIAKALNCVGPDGQGGPTISPCGKCEPCIAIAEGRHIDVIEMDAASHTGVDDVREIIEAVRYAAVSARYKIYIIDEVHMLSRNAFNALLKTLEEPPAHVKFLFATTEVDKLPVTVLSRCQRFDLRRIPAPLLQQHFAGICVKEGVEAEDDALAMVAAAAEGSVRDGLSILDQAIAHADLDTGGKVTGERVRDMLGLADRSALRTLFAALLNGDPQGLLALVDNQYSLGVEPLALMRSLMDVCHRITVAQIGRAGEAATAEERALIEEWAEKLSPGQLHRLWQLLLKGHDEVRQAPDPLVAAQMALLRVMHAADMPDPGTLAKKLEEMAASGAFTGAPSSGGSTSSGGDAPVQARAAPAVSWPELVEQIEHSGLPGHMTLANKMKLQVRVVDIAPGRLVYSLAPPFKEDLSAELRDAFMKITGERWEIERVAEGGASTLVEAVENAKSDEVRRIREAPLVKAAFNAFPGAELVEEEPPAQGNQRQWGRR